MTLRRNRYPLLVISAALAGLLYNSWPLGYILNHHVATVFLASNLEATGQPYNWLFILGDILTGLIIMAVGCFYLRKKNLISLRWVKLSIGCYVIFGLLTIVTALIPFNCQESIAQCSVQLSTSFGLHDIIACIASITQFISMVCPAVVILRAKVKGWLKSATLAILLAFCVSGIVFLITSLINGSLAVFLQHVFIILSGLGLLLLPIALNLKIEPKKVTVTETKA